MHPGLFQPEAEGDATLAEKLNLFFAHFEVEPPETAKPHLMAYSSLTLTVKESEVSQTLRCANLRKGTGPDSIPGWAQSQSEGLSGLKHIYGPQPQHQLPQGCVLSLLFYSLSIPL